MSGSDYLTTGDTNCIDIAAGVLQRDTLELFLFIISADCVLWLSRDLMKENGFTLKKMKYKWYPAENITAADSVDDQVRLVNTPAQAESLLHSLEQSTKGIGLYMNSDKTDFMCFNQDGANFSCNASHWN